MGTSERIGKHQQILLLLPKLLLLLLPESVFGFLNAGISIAAYHSPVNAEDL